MFHRTYPRNGLYPILWHRVFDSDSIRCYIALTLSVPAIYFIPTRIKSKPPAPRCVYSTWHHPTAGFREKVPGLASSQGANLMAASCVEQEFDDRHWESILETVREI
jgi:hypothetical protein